MGFDNTLGQTVLIKCALVGDAAVGKSAIGTDIKILKMRIPDKGI